jgi:hypothetical protein
MTSSDFYPLSNHINLFMVINIWGIIIVIMSVEAFRTDVIVFICDVIMCFTSDWQINLCFMQVTNWANIFVDQGQFGDPDFISGTH